MDKVDGFFLILGFYMVLPLFCDYETNQSPLHKSLNNRPKNR